VSFGFTEEQIMLRESARDFIADQAPVSQLRKLRDNKDPIGFSQDVWEKFSEMGFTGVLVPEEFGGMGLGHVEAGIIMEQIGHHLTTSPFLASSVAAVTALRHVGTAAQKNTWLPKLASGEVIASIAIDEKAKHRPAQVALRATPTDSGYTLNGVKTFVSNGHVADILIVAARRAGEPGDSEGITLFIVDSKSQGIETERTVMVDSQIAARITFKEVKVGVESVLGPVDSGWETLSATLDAARAAAAAEMLGLSDEVFDRTLKYLKERKQFGRLIGEFQALQHRAAMLYCDLEITRSLVIHAQKQLDASSLDVSRAVSLAKARAGRTATLAVQEAVQMHGGIGMTDELEIGFFMKRARVLNELFGDTNFHIDQVAAQQGY